jgi:hypothetical protein
VTAGIASVGNGAAQFFSSVFSGKTRNAETSVTNPPDGEVELTDDVDNVGEKNVYQGGLPAEDTRVLRMKKFQQIVSPDAKRVGYRLGSYMDKVVLKSDYGDIVLNKDQHAALLDHLLGAHGQINKDFVFDYLSMMSVLANQEVQMHLDDRVYRSSAEEHVKAAVSTYITPELLGVAKRYATHSYAKILEGHPLPPKDIRLTLPKDAQATSQRSSLTGDEFINLTHATRAESKTKEEGAQKLLDVLSSLGSDSLEVDTGETPKTLSLVDLIRFAVPDYSDVKLQPPSPSFNIEDYLTRSSGGSHGPPLDLYYKQKQQLERIVSKADASPISGSVSRLVSNPKSLNTRTSISNPLKRDRRLVEEFPRSHVSGLWLGQQKMLYLVNKANEEILPLAPWELSLVVDSLISTSQDKSEAAKRLEVILRDASDVLIAEPHIGSPRPLSPEAARRIIFPEVRKPTQSRSSRREVDLLSHILSGHALSSKEVRFNVPSEVKSTSSGRSYLTADELISLAKATRADVKSGDEAAVSQAIDEAEGATAEEALMRRAMEGALANTTDEAIEGGMESPTDEEMEQRVLADLARKADEEGAHKLLEVLSELGTDFLDVDTGDATRKMALIDLIRLAVPEYANVAFKSSLKSKREDRPASSKLEDYIRKGQQLREGELTFDNDVVLPRMRVDNRALGSHLRRQLIP